MRDGRWAGLWRQKREVNKQQCPPFQGDKYYHGEEPIGNRLFEFIKSNRDKIRLK